MILDDIVAKTRIRVQKDKAAISEADMKKAAEQTENKLPPFAFEQALKHRDIGFICEVKKASPSKGVIAEEFPYIQIARDYERSGASCISVLTEPDFFQGKNEYLTEIKREVGLPIIRKDFVIDAYQIYQAKAIGADAVLLICAVLDTETIKRYIQICDSLGLSALVEAHNEEEITSALNAGARMIGVNNRNLKDFTVDIRNSIRLRKLVPEDVVFVAESGIKGYAEIQELRAANVNGVLIGETLMRSPDKTRMLNSLRGTKVKICGLIREEDITMVNELRPDYIGFVFAESRRKVSDEQAKRLKAKLSKEIPAVGVFVNDSIEHISMLWKEGIIDMIQLHGDEDEAFITVLRRVTQCPVIRAIRVKDMGDIQEGMKTCADYVLLDTFQKDAYGGTGEQFDLQLIPEGYRPYFLAGGVSGENVEDIIQKWHPYAVDVSSGVETDGFKDYQKVKDIIQRVRTVWQNPDES